MDTKQLATKRPMGEQRNKKKIKKHLKTNENGNTKIQNLWDAANQF